MEKHETKVLEYTPEEAEQELSKEETAAIEARKKALDALLTADHRKARYKVELVFGKARSMHRPTPGVLSFWESGSMLHGGGDTKLYICPGKSLGVNDCRAFIPHSANSSEFLWCGKCGQKWKGSQVIGEVMARLSLPDWAKLLLKYYTRLEHHADIYLKYSKDDVRTAAMIEQATQKGGEVLQKVRGKRAKQIYSLARIIKDTSAGADLLGRFRAFLTA